MVNIQTSQYELLIFTFYLSRLGIFQCVRAILQLSLPIDHPVAATLHNTGPAPGHLLTIPLPLGLPATPPSHRFESFILKVSDLTTPTLSDSHNYNE